MIYAADRILSRVLTISDYTEVYDRLHPQRLKWKPIGERLNLRINDLENIDDENRSNDQRLKKMILGWLRRRNLKPTWQSLIDALRHRTVDEEGAAEDLLEYLLSRPAAGELFTALAFPCSLVTILFTGVIRWLSLISYYLSQLTVYTSIITTSQYCWGRM